MEETAVKLTVKLKTSETKQFIKTCDVKNSTVTLNSLHENCVALQSEVNGFLTTLVEEERRVSNVNSDSKMDGNSPVLLLRNR